MTSDWLAARPACRLQPLGRFSGQPVTYKPSACRSNPASLAGPPSPLLAGDTEEVGNDLLLEVRILLDRIGLEPGIERLGRLYINCLPVSLEEDGRADSVRGVEYLGSEDCTADTLLY